MQYIPVEFVQSLIAVQAVLGSTPLDSTDTSWGANARHWGQSTVFVISIDLYNVSKQNCSLSLYSVHDHRGYLKKKVFRGLS